MTNPRDVVSVADAKAIVEARDIEYVKIGLHDVDGVLRGKYMACDKLKSAFQSGFGFCDVIADTGTCNTGKAFLLGQYGFDTLVGVCQATEVL